MKLIEFKEEVYDSALSKHLIHPVELNHGNRLQKLLKLPEVAATELRRLMLVQASLVVGSPTPDYAVVWKNWDDLSPAPFDVVTVLEEEKRRLIRREKRVSWQSYEGVLEAVGDVLKIGKKIVAQEQAQEWPYEGWKMTVRRSLRFPGVSLLWASEYYGALSGGIPKALGGAYLPSRTVAVVTNFQEPLKTPLV